MSATDIISPPGNMVIVQGDREVKDWLLTGSARVDDWLYELVDGAVFYAAQRIKEHAPGHIDQLVDVSLAHEHATGAFEGAAGVEPEITESTFHVGLGSDPADFPVFVEVGTGIFGPIGQPISSIPGHLMGPINDGGREIFVAVIQGQRPQHYVENAYHDLVETTPVRIQEKLPELGRHHE